MAVDISPLAQYGAIGIILAACLVALAWIVRRFVAFLERLVDASSIERVRFLELMDKQGDLIAHLKDEMQVHRLESVAEMRRLADGVNELCTTLRKLNGR